jgi:hypothetical protein
MRFWQTDFCLLIVRRCRCGLWYRASKSRNARASYWQNPAWSFFFFLPLVVRAMRTILMYLTTLDKRAAPVHRIRCVSDAARYYKYSSTYSYTKMCVHLLSTAVCTFARCPSAADVHPVTVFLAARKSRTMELLAFDEKSTFDCFCFLLADKPRLVLSAKREQKIQKLIFHRKLRVRTSEGSVLFLSPVQI